MTQDLGPDGLPDYIEAKDYSNVDVYLDGRKVYLCDSADRKAGVVKILVTADPAHDNFSPDATPLVPIVDDELTGKVTFRIK